MDKDLKDIKLGSAGDLDVALKDGNLVMTLSYQTGALVAGASMTVDSGVLLDKLAALIPGVVDDAVIALIKSALKA